MNRRTIILGFIAIVNLGAALGVQLYLVSRFGLGGAMDAFFAASTLPQIGLAVLIGSVTNVLTPFFSGRPTDEDLFADAWAVLFWTFVVLLGLAVLIAGSAGFLTALLLPGLARGDQRAAIELTMIMAAGLPFLALAQVSTAIHQGLGRFVWAGAVDAAMSVALLGAVVILAPAGGVTLAAWLFTARAAIQAAVLMSPFGAPSFHPRRPAVRVVLTGMRPLLMSTSYFKMAPVLDRWIASFGAPGDISLLYLLQQIFAGGAALFGKAVVEPLVGSLAVDRKRGLSMAERMKHYHAIHRPIAWLALTGYGAALAAVALFARFVVSPELAQRLTLFLIAFGGLYTAGFLGQLSAAWFYAVGDTRTPARIGALGFSLAIGLRLALFPIFGAVAIAVAISANQAVNWLMLRHAILKTRNKHDVPVS